MKLFRHFKLLYLCIILLPVFSCDVQQGGKTERVSVIIPPFENLRNIRDYDYFSIGLSDEMSRKLAYSDVIDVIDPAFLIEKITLNQLIGGEENTEKLLDIINNRKTKIAVLGSFHVSFNNRILELKAKVVRVADKMVLVEVSEKGKIDEWSYIRGTLAIKIAKELGIQLSQSDSAKLKEVETRNFKAFRDNYLGRLYYYKSLEAKVRKKQKEVNKYKQLSMLHYSKAILSDLKYRNARKNYIGTFSFKKLISTKEEKKERVQGRLNDMTIFGLKNNRQAKKNISDWIDTNREVMVSMINGLPDEYILEVQGHTDANGSYTYRKTISAERARRIFNQLLDIGVFKDKLIYRGYGSDRMIRWLNPTHESNNRITFEVKSIIK